MDARIKDSKREVLVTLSEQHPYTLTIQTSELPDARLIWCINENNVNLGPCDVIEDDGTFYIKFVSTVKMGKSTLRHLEVVFHKTGFIFCPAVFQSSNIDEIEAMFGSLKWEDARNQRMDVCVPGYMRSEEVVSRVQSTIRHFDSYLKDAVRWLGDDRLKWCDNAFYVDKHLCWITINDWLQPGVPVYEVRFDGDTIAVIDPSPDAAQKIIDTFLKVLQLK